MSAQTAPRADIHAFPHPALSRRRSIEDVSQTSSTSSSKEPSTLDGYDNHSKRNGTATSTATTAITPPFSDSESDDLLTLSQQQQQQKLQLQQQQQQQEQEQHFSSSSNDSNSKAALSHPPPNAVRLIPARAFDIDPYWLPDPSDPYCLLHSEFGHDENPNHRYTSQWRGEKYDNLSVNDEEPSYFTLVYTYVSYVLLIVLGHLRDFFGKRFRQDSYKHLREHNGFAALNSDFDSFYTRRLKLRMEDCFSRPVTGVAGRTLTIIDRDSYDYNKTFFYTGKTTQALNISSYNYLGFAQSRGGCADAVQGTIEKYGIGSGGNRGDSGNLELVHQVEALLAKFLGVEDLIMVSMGFATNSTSIASLVSKGSIVISDELNHSSIRFGVRLSGAMVRSFKHNDMADLERLLREVISQGQPRTHRPWRNILLIVEGIYSMEGTILNLPAIMKLKAKYKFNLYIDEAHSIGALGPNGRGVCDYFGIDPQNAEIMMGTLTKSFGAMGGYIAGKRDLIQHLRREHHATAYAETPTPPVIRQIMASIACIMGPQALEVVPDLKLCLPPRLLDGSEGRERLRRIAFNARYLSSSLRKMGFIVYGHRDSPIVPLLIFAPAKLPCFSRLMLQRHNIVVVVVAYPATPLVSGRVRFCVSAAHTKYDIDRLLRACDDVGTILGLKYSRRGPHLSAEQAIACCLESVHDDNA